VIEVTPQLRTAPPAEADRLPHHEEPVSLANSRITIRACGFYQFREGGMIMDMSFVLFIAIGILSYGLVAGLFHTVAVARRRARETRTWTSRE